MGDRFVSSSGVIASTTMPAQKCIRLPDGQSLFPGPQHAGQPHQQDTLVRLESRTLHLAIEHDEPLSQKGILEYEFRLAAGEV
ncbi:MAG: hypothetical protein E3J37_06335 [Anaerolineales bacterium]|nr:MAG: hypothetical protein E3J37_06335 [Anaerolineales bacterium]